MAEVGGYASPNHGLTTVVRLKAPRGIKVMGVAIVTVNKTRITSNHTQDELFIGPVLLPLTVLTA